MNMTRFKALAVTTVLTSFASWMGGHASDVIHGYGRHLLAGALFLGTLGAGVFLIRRA